MPWRLTSAPGPEWATPSWPTRQAQGHPLAVALWHQGERRRAGPPEALAGLRSLNLGGTDVTDAGLAHLRGLEKLSSLDLRVTVVTDAGLARLASLKGLESLNLSATKVSDAGLAHLKGLATLHSLNLNGTGVTDAGLVHLTRPR